VYALLTSVALSAMPVHPVGSPDAVTGSLYATELGTKYQPDPIVGIVKNLPAGLEGAKHALTIWVGLLAASILIIASNAALLGFSRLTFAQSHHRHLPAVFGELNPRTAVPWVAVVVGGVVAGVLLLPALFGVEEANLLGALLSFGALIGFTSAHFAVVRLRWLGVEGPGTFRIPGAIRVRGAELAIVPLLGGIGTVAVWLTVVATHVAARWVGLGWMLAGLTLFVFYRRRQGLPVLERVTTAAIALEEIEEAEEDAFEIME